MRKKFELKLHPDPRPDLLIERGPDDSGVGSWVPIHGRDDLTNESAAAETQSAAASSLRESIA